MVPQASQAPPPISYIYFGLGFAKKDTQEERAHLYGIWSRGYVSDTFPFIIHLKSTYCHELCIVIH
jgi:hypothetical protein